jgi:MFS family permease
MFAIYFAASAAAIAATFGLDVAPETRLHMYFFIGLSVSGVFGSFTYYLPELFPTQLRATGAGFCYNIGRVIAAAGPLVVGYVASLGLDHALRVLVWVAVVPLAGLVLMPLVVETRNRALADELPAGHCRSSVACWPGSEIQPSANPIAAIPVATEHCSAARNAFAS